MRRGILTVAVLLAGTTMALAGNNLVANGKGQPSRAVIWQGTVAATPCSQGRTPALYQSNRPLGTLASLRLGSAIPALRAAAGERAVLVFDGGKGHVVRARDLAMPPLVFGEPRASALEFLRAHAEAFGLPLEPEDAWIASEVEGAAGTHHLGFEQRADDGVPIYGAIVTVHTDALGAPLMVQSEADPEPVTFRPALPITAKVALFRAAGGALLSQATTSTRLVYYRTGDSPDYRLTYQVDVGAARSFVDAETGMVMDRIDRRCYVDADANVWDPNSLDGSPPYTVDPANTEVRTLTQFDTSGWPKGTWLTISDKVNALAGRTPAPGAPGADFTPYLGAGNPQQVEQLSVYFYITSAQSKMQSLSSSAFATLSQFFPLKAILDIDEVANAFFDPSDRSLQFGQGEAAQGIDHLERDLDVAAHEFGHFVEATFAPDLTPRLNSPRRAMGEGFGDFTAATVNGVSRPNEQGAYLIGESVVPAGGGNFTYLRDINNSKQSPGDVVGEEHHDGEIIAGALWSLAETITGSSSGHATSASLDEGYRVLLAGLPFLPRSNAQFSDLVDALVRGDRARTGVNPGIHENAIKDAFAAHGIFPTSTAPVTTGGTTPAGANSQPKEILLGVPHDVAIGANTVARFFVRVPADLSTVLEVNLSAISGSGDADLYVAPNNYDGDLTKIVKSIATGTGTQAVTVTSTLATGRDTAGTETPSPAPTVTLDTFWLIDVLSATQATYRLTARNTAAAAEQPVSLGTFSGTPISQPGTIGVLDEVDVFYFDGTKDQIVGVQVLSGGVLVPAVWLFDPDLNIIAVDDDGSPVVSATIQGHPLPEDGRYVIAVAAFSPEHSSATTTGAYTLNVKNGSLPGLEIARTGTGAKVTSTIQDGEQDVYHITLDPGDTRLEFYLSPTNTASTGDIDLYLTPANSTSETWEFYSVGLGSTEHVEASIRTNPSVQTSRYWFVVVSGANVSALRSGVTGATEGYTLTAVVNRPFGGGGGGGCGFQPALPGSAAALWPLLAALAGAALLRRRRRQPR